MEEFKFVVKEEPVLKNPILIEGLPGIGNVGKIAAMHLIKEIGAKKFMTLYSPLFPPQVIVNDSGLIETMRNEFYYKKAEKSSQRDLILVTGNTQSATPSGQYALTQKILETALDYNVSYIYTLGGLGVGRLVENPKVFGAVTDESHIPELEKLGTVLKRVGVGQIIGVSGLLLGLGKLHGVAGACLMGETSGYYRDPNSAKAVLEILVKLLDLDVDMKGLSRKVIDTEKMLAEAQEMEKRMLQEMGMVQKEPSEDEMRYIG
ncbi:MAG: proteasome assembly chaperone family protein [Candidatus Hydrothermarchaeales archaeon]